MSPIGQRAFDLPVVTGFGHADFLVSDSNRSAFDWIERWPDWPARALVLYGPPGCGKTHLAHLWRQKTSATLIAGEAVAGAEPWSFAGQLAVDDADRAAEEPLLHLYNSCSERGGNLLLTMLAPPAATAFALADLGSRMRALPTAGIAPPDDALLAAVLVKHFADRQIRVAPGLIAYLVPRMERSFAAAAALAARLDQLALSAGKPVSVKLARGVLAEFAT
jgi:chromosomal replication initiation ATPase DnaA